MNKNKIKSSNASEHINFQPLATRMRPRSIEEYIGQSHLLGEGKPLRLAISKGQLHSMILWGPPGVGKTSLAHLLSQSVCAHFEAISAVYTTVKEIRLLVEQAKLRQSQHHQPTILFIDEVHRFNKAQQDIFLPYIEDGSFIFIGATTENPSFELNRALLSRARTYVLKPLQEHELLALIEQVLRDKQHGLGEKNLIFPQNSRCLLIQAVDGDARRLINLLEILSDLVQDNESSCTITESLLQEVLQTNLRQFDKKGDYFYDQISALHKSVRGSAPDAALYWLCRMLDGGCDPKYLTRRMIRMANEDIGLADPRALELAIQADMVYERLGSPEGELALAQAVIYLACAPKSNAIYSAYLAAQKLVATSGSLDVPNHLKNAPTQLMKQLGFGKHYRYAHDEPNAYAAGEQYFPELLNNPVFYQPTTHGLESKISERLTHLKSLDKLSNK